MNLSKKKISFEKPVYVLAPLAGFTDLPFRSVVKKFGADLTVSEMISSNALAHGSEKTLHMLKKSPLEDPYSVQISANDPEMARRAVEVLNEKDGIDIIDLNCGCPVPKVFGHGSGSALLDDLPRLKAILKTIKETSNKSMTTAKIRLGVNDKNHINIAKNIEEVGVDFIAVHGRTRAGKYKAPVDYEAIKEIKDSVSIPVIANGDIDSYEKAKWVLEYTGADGVMIGRGAVGAPWLFHQLKSGKSEIDLELRHKIVLEHYDKMIEFYGAHGVAMFRKHTHTYTKGYKGASALRDSVNRISDIHEYRDTIDHFFKNGELA
jgi:tRNA-dihydrouridine synthase B